ncbi:hypothetical protein EVG20_g7916 [Dentipellis fragilis]|uniref:Uncharacterized protein n=1 Tax=Dentipellis fragilis TaxID=205917 RepID=A0A4Y9YBW4_9AGAM|nr:hypothetical protein EVG20_g7916 [Dentipellis fragilis]
MPSGSAHSPKIARWSQTSPEAKPKLAIIQEWWSNWPIMPGRSHSMPSLKRRPSEAVRHRRGPEARGREIQRRKRVASDTNRSNGHQATREAYFHAGMVRRSRVPDTVPLSANWILSPNRKEMAVTEVHDDRDTKFRRLLREQQSPKSVDN